MKRKWLFGIVALAVAGIGVVLFSGRKGTAPARPDPAFYHTPEGVHATIQEQRTVLADALKNKDLPFIHGQMYYLEGLADALSAKLEGERKQRVDARLAELKAVAEEVDNFSGRGNLEATEAGLTKLFAALDALNAEFQPAKK